jgi:hypothetical protein
MFNLAAGAGAGKHFLNMFSIFRFGRPPSRDTEETE